MKKYYVILVNENVIKVLGTTSKIRSNMTEITKAEYDNYKAILASIPSKQGYTKKVTLYLDGTYEVEYEPIVVEEDDNEQ